MTPLWLCVTILQSKINQLTPFCSSWSTLGACATSPYIHLRYSCPPVHTWKTHLKNILVIVFKIAPDIFKILKQNYVLNQVTSVVYICLEVEIYIVHIHLLQIHLVLTFLRAETFIKEYSILFLSDIPSKGKVLWFIHCKVSLLKCQRLRNEKYWYTYQNVSG